jgi:hypothetical protein
MTWKTLEEAYESVCATVSDIYLHCPTLKNLAEGKDHVTEFGCRRGISTIALLSGKPKHLISYDFEFPAIANARNVIKPLAGNTVYEAKLADTREIEIEPTDVLFIDTLHVYEQLLCELDIHQSKVRGFIACHDTHTFACQGEHGAPPGLSDAIRDFLGLYSEWYIYSQTTENNGLTILARR